MLHVVKKIILVGILYISFFIHGIFEETVYKSEYSLVKLNPETNKEEEIKFKFNQANLNYFIVSLILFLVSTMVVYQNKMRHTLYSTKDKMIMGT